MLAIRLPAELEKRLDSLAKATGRTKTFYVREAILEHLDDLEDLYLAEQRLIDLRAGRSHTYTLEEVERAILAWRIEIDEKAKKDLTALARLSPSSSLSFCASVSPGSMICAALVKHSKAPSLVNFGNIALVTIALLPASKIRFCVFLWCASATAVRCIGIEELAYTYS